MNADQTLVEQLDAIERSVKRLKVRLDAAWIVPGSDDPLAQQFVDGIAANVAHVERVVRDARASLEHDRVEVVANALDALGAALAVHVVKDGACVDCWSAWPCLTIQAVCGAFGIVTVPVEPGYDGAEPTGVVIAKLLDARTWLRSLVERLA